MKFKGSSPYLAGGSLSIADIALTPHNDKFLCRLTVLTRFSKA